MGTVSDGAFGYIDPAIADLLRCCREAGHQLRLSDTGKLQLNPPLPKSDRLEPGDLRSGLLRHEDAITKLVGELTADIWPPGRWVQIG